MVYKIELTGADNRIEDLPLKSFPRKLHAFRVYCLPCDAIRWEQSKN